MKGGIKEGKKVIDASEIAADVKDARLIAAAQKIEHYEIASYGKVIHFAKLPGADRVAELLNRTLEAMNADQLLSGVATNQVNAQAAKRTSGEVGGEGGGGRPSASR